MPGAVLPATDVIWNTGFLFGTIHGGATDDVPFGQLQEVQLKDDLTLQKLYGPAQLVPAAIGVKERVVTGTAKNATIRARHFKMLRGSDPTYDNVSSKTTWDAGVNDEPKQFNLHLKSPSDGSDWELLIYGCISPNLNVPAPLRDFVIPDFSFEAYGDGTKIYRVILPGDQTTS